MTNTRKTKPKRRDRGSAILLAGPTDLFPDIRYRTAFTAPDPLVFLEYGSERALVVSGLEYGRAAAAARDVTVWTPEQLDLKGPERRELALWAERACRRWKIRRVRVPTAFPIGIARRLEAAGIRVDVETGMLFPERAVKRREEIACIRSSQQAAVIAMRAAMAFLEEADTHRDGSLVRHGERVTSEQVQNRIDRILLEHDCIGNDTIVAGGPQGADPHERGHGPLRAGEPIVIDIFPRHRGHGYWGDMTRTVARGAVSPAVQAMYQAVRAAQRAALAAVRPRVKGATVHAAAARELEQRGFKTCLQDGRPVGFIHGTGHGVGLQIHEPPTLGLADGRLRKGQVVTVEPGLYYPRHGGVRIEDTVVVTADGWRYLAPCEKKLNL